MNDKYIQSGWLCPRCGTVNAPWMAQCTCNDKKSSITCWDGNIEPPYIKMGDSTGESILKNYVHVTDGDNGYD